MKFIVLQAAEAISKTNQKYYKLTVLTLQKEKFDLFVWNPQLISKGFCFEVNDADIKDNGNKSTSFGNLSSVSDEVKEQLQALIPQPVSREDWDALRDLIAADIDDSPICKVFIMEMNNLYDKYKEKPAASGVHQAYPGGLLNHVFLALKYLRAIINTSSLPLNKPVAFLAMLIHDHGKMYEYSEGEDGSIIVNPEYYLLGHMYMGASYAKKLGELGYPDIISGDPNIVTFMGLDINETEYYPIYAIQIFRPYKYFLNYQCSYIYLRKDLWNDREKWPISYQKLY